MTKSDVTRKPSYSDFAAVVSYGSSLSFSPDGREIACSSNASGQFNLWVYPVDGSEPRQLTSYTDEAVRQLAWSPKGDQIVFTADAGGNEKHQLRLTDPTGSSVESMTDRPDVQYYLAGDAWSADGNYILYAGNDREPTAQDVIIREVPTGEDDRPVADGGVSMPGGWSPDGKFISSTEVRSNTDTFVLLSDLEQGITETVLGADDDHVYAAGPWAADGAGFWVVTDRDREFNGLGFYAIDDRSFAWVETPEWDIESVSASHDGRYLAWSTNVSGKSVISLRDLDSGDLVALPDIPQGVLGSELTFSPDGSQIAFRLEAATAPAEIYLLDIPAQTLTKLTDSLRFDLSSIEMVDPELVDFETFDGRRIPAWLYRPVGTGTFPVVLSIHGGPESQERPTYGYRGFYQYLLSRGIGVLAPNIRGSSGYGKSYQKLIHRDLGGNDVHDFEAAAKYLQSLEWVDKDRIGVFGGSYGGFAVLTCVSRLPEYWAAAVDIVGPSNLVTMLKSFPPTWKEMAKQTFGDVDSEEEDLLRRSPITYVDQIETPLFIIQGANDPRVVKAESDQIVEKLRERGVNVRYDVYEDEGHGFTKKENELKAIGDSAAFFEEHLLAT